MFGKWLKGERERRGWSQAELARRAGLSPQAIGQLEHNRQRRPYPDTMAALARAFDLRAADLYHAVYGDYPPPPAHFLPGELVGLWPRLAADDQETILRVARGLVRNAGQ